MSKVAGNKTTAHIDDIYWQLNEMSGKCITAQKLSRVCWIVGIVLLILSCLYDFYILVPAIALIVVALIKGKEGRTKSLDYYQFIMGIIEAVRDDVRSNCLASIALTPNPRIKPIVDDKTVSEPRFYSVRRIKYKYMIAELRFTMMDGNILKVRLLKKEREKIKRDHSYKRYFRDGYLLKIRLEVRNDVYDSVAAGDSMSGEYELTPNIVICGLHRDHNFATVKARLVVLGQYSGRQVAGMIKSLYRGYSLKKMAQV